MRATISKKIAGIAGLGLVLLAGVTTSNLLAARSQQQSLQRLEQATTVVAEATLIDMYHDGIRAAVLDLSLARTSMSSPEVIATKAQDVTDAADAMLGSLDTVISQHFDPEVDTAGDAVRPQVIAYTNLASGFAEGRARPRVRPGLHGRIRGSSSRRWRRASCGQRGSRVRDAAEVERADAISRRSPGDLVGVVRGRRTRVGSGVGGARSPDRWTAQDHDGGRRSIPLSAISPAVSASRRTTKPRWAWRSTRRSSS
ncbi:MAG: hypothetical protein R2705_11150 [Ilumatobacteraceae bacterium]